MIVTIDVGNSNTVLGGYIDDKICFIARVNTDRHIEADQIALQLRGIFSLYHVENEPITHIAISSVVPSFTPLLIKAFSHFTSVMPLVLSLKNTGTIHVDIEHPAELGMDILASALAVQKKYPLPAAIIDMGTATKISALDAGDNLRGVSIAPGLFISLDAMVSGTSLLNRVALSSEQPLVAIGRNTTQSIQSGVLLGNAAMLDGLLDRFSEELGELKTIVATGGAAPFIIPHCRHKIEYAETLLLDGLLQALIQQ